MSRITTLMRQLPLDRLLAKLTAEGVRKMLNGSSSYTYAQNGEDILAMSLLGWPSKGFYVDVGCNLPEKRSNTFLFYLRGASGIGVDANSAFCSIWKKARPRDTFIEACIGKGDEVDFHTFKGHALSSVGGERVEGVHGSQYTLVEKRTVTTVPLQTLLDEHGAPSTFDMLSVDVEGYDEVALSTIDLKVYRPRLIVVEAHQPDIMKLADNPLVTYLYAEGYQLVAVQKSNMFFLVNS